MPLIKIGSTILNTDAIESIDLSFFSEVHQSQVVLVTSSSGRERFFEGEQAEMLRTWFASQRSGVMDLDRLWQSIKADREVQRG